MGLSENRVPVNLMNIDYRLSIDCIIIISTKVDMWGGEYHMFKHTPTLNIYSGLYQGCSLSIPMSDNYLHGPTNPHHHMTLP